MLPEKTARERFFQSCANGDLKSIKADMFHNVSPFSQDRYGNNALHLACINNQPRVLQYLLGTVKRYKTDTPNKLGRTALNIAASQGAFECIEILLDNLDCDINSTDKNFKNTPLHWCITSKCVEGVKKLLNLGADFKLVNKFGETPLQLAKISCPDVYNIIDKFINDEDEGQCLRKITQISNNTKIKENISPESSSDLSQFKLTAGSSKLDSASFQDTAKQQRIINDTNVAPADLPSSNSNEPFFLDISKFKNGDNSVLKLLEKSIEPVDETSFVSSILNSGKVIQLTEAGILALEYTKNEITTPIPDRLVKSFLTTSKQCEKNKIDAPETESTTIDSKTPSKGSKRLKSPPPLTKKLKFTETTVVKKSEFEILLEQLNIKYPKNSPRVNNNSSANSSQNVSSLDISTAKNNNKYSIKNQLVCLNSDVNGHPKWVEDLMSLLKEIVEYKSTEPASS